MLTQSPFGVPKAQSRMWSMAAEAAEAAEEAPRALMMAAPRCCTVGMNSPAIHSWLTSLAAGLPLTLVARMSGYWVEEWLPHTVMRLMSVTWLPVLAASCDRERLWSRRIIALKFFLGMRGALEEAISALVLAGLPTTSTFTFFLAAAFKALPWAEKILAFSVSRSLRSMPGPRGRAPTSKAKSASLN